MRISPLGTVLISSVLSSKLKIVPSIGLPDSKVTIIAAVAWMERIRISRMILNAYFPIPVLILRFPEKDAQCEQECRHYGYQDNGQGI